MGLIVSVLVVCVGVYEFIQLFCNPGKKVDLKTKEINCVNNKPINSGCVPKIQLCREFLSHEDVEIECSSQVLRQSSKSPSPRRFLVTEKDDNRSRSASPRKFVVNEEDESRSYLREFFITKGIPKDDPAMKRYVLIDTKEDFREVSPLPLPKQFLITQNKTSFSHEILENVKHGIGVHFDSLNFQREGIENSGGTVSQSLEKTLSEFSGINSVEDLLYCHGTEFDKEIPFKSRNAPSKCEMSSSIHDLYAKEPAEFHRDPSPYPGLDVFIRRSSITSELLENPKVAIAEIDEEPYNTSTKIDVILNSRNFNTTEYWSNKILVEPSMRWKNLGSHDSMSQSDSKDNSVNSVNQKHYKMENEKLRSKSVTRENVSPESHMRKVSSSSKMFDEDYQASSGLFKDVLERGGDEVFRNSLDGVKKGNEARRSFKRKKNKSQNSLENALEHCEEKNKRIQEQTDAPENTLLIFSGEYTKAMNKDWHGQHFCCWQCDESLTGQRYVLRDDHPYCVSCYESVFANACEKCSRTIGIDSKDLSYKDKHWHEACFLCTTCGESLVDKQFGSKGERIYCGRCYDNQFASRCDGCNEIFRAGTKKMEYKTRQWHEKCFCCCVCKVPIGTQSFIPREQEIYCAKCYEEKFATRCIKCNKVITSGGVTYKNEPWHRECFTCTHCSKSLAGERFTSREDKPYCAECFGELFAKRCFACNKPITGIGGTKFISFEDRHWHNDCFFCASCRTSLVGRGFITDQEDIICPDCAKQKLL